MYHITEQSTALSRSPLSATSSSQRASLSQTQNPTRVNTTKPSNDGQNLPLSPARVAAIKKIVSWLLEKCDTPYHTDPYDTDLHNLCLVDASKKGYPIGHGLNEVNPDRYLRCGVIIASGAYGHLPRQYQVFIAVYTAFATWIDDAYSDDLEGIDMFYERFLSGQRQHSDGLDAMARIIKETTSVYGPTSAQAGIIVMATLRFISGSLLEYEGKTMASTSRSFSSYLRSFTGIPEAYAMFIFPPGLSIRTYMQVIPDICHYINHYNDVLSFYKEEKAGEINNYLSLEAAVLNEDKLITLNRLASEVATSSGRVLQALDENAEAVRAFKGFQRGYLTFHTSLESRYFLLDLFG